MAVTAKIRCNNRQPGYNGSETLTFYADYQDGRNKEWAEATPSLSLTMTVKKEIAEQHFPQGKAFTLTFEPEEDQAEG